jgi:Dolichyl-phosphate-mannose-protein mannosyltransferase
MRGARSSLPNGEIAPYKRTPYNGLARRGGAGTEQRIMRVLLKRLSTSPLFIAGVALALRLLILWLSWHRAAGADAGPFGYEAGQVAKSIASGKGFSSPLTLVETGPTAFTSPVSPYLLAGIFKLWGIFTVRSHIVAQAVGCLMSALTIFPLYAIAKRTFGAVVAVVSSWVWVILPSAWHAPIAYIVETSFTVFWLTLLMWATLRLRSETRLPYWLGYGALWVFGVLLNASLVALLPFFLAWLIWGLRRQSAPSWRLASAFVLMFGLLLTPWTVRNFTTFGKFIPLRSALGLELWVGNNPDESDVRSFSAAPSFSASESNTYKAMGEISYMSLKRREAVEFIWSHRAITGRRIASRIFDFWFAVTDRPQGAWASYPVYLKAFFCLNVIFIVLSWFGLASAWRILGFFEIALHAAVVLVYPLAYYLMLGLARYRYPIEPFLVVLGVYGLTQAAVSIRLIHLQSARSSVDDLDESETVEA